MSRQKTREKISPMGRFLVFVSLMAAQTTLFNALNKAQLAYEEGKFEHANTIFQESRDAHFDDEKFQTDYLNFLMRTGKYEDIVAMAGRIKKSNASFVEKARMCLNKLRSMNLKEISGLVGLSPNAFDVVVAAAEYHLENENYGEFKKYITKATQLVPDSVKAKKLQARLYLVTGDYDMGMKLLLESQEYAMAHTFSTLLSKYNEAVEKKGLTPRQHFSEYVALHSLISSKMINDNCKPTIYKQLYKQLLEKLTAVGSNNSIERTSRYAEWLVKMDETPNNAYMYVKTSIVDKKPLHECKNLLNHYRARLSAAMQRTLDALISQREEQIRQQQERQRRQEQLKREQQERQQQERQRRMNARGKAGDDFLGYYKALGIPASASAQEIKKAHKKKIRLASLKSKDIKKREDDMKLVNKAYRILSNSESKMIYDQGGDPENPHQSPPRSQYYGSSEGVNQELADMFKRYFQEELRPSGGYGRRTSYFVFE